jgi:hypothetical protein
MDRLLPLLLLMTTVEDYSIDLKVVVVHVEVVDDVVRYNVED